MDNRLHAQAECLIPMIDDIMKESEKSFQGLKAIICTSGPGSFTGLRTGLAAAKAIALSANLPLYGISSFDAYALQFRDKGDKNKPLCVLVESRRAEFFCQLYDMKGTKTGEPLLILAKDLENHLAAVFKDKKPVLIGNGIPRLLEEINPALEYVQDHVHLDIKSLPKVFRDNAEQFIRDPVPLYLRGADISQPKHKPRQIG